MPFEEITVYVKYKGQVHIVMCPIEQKRLALNFMTDSETKTLKLSPALKGVSETPLGQIIGE